MQENKAKTNPTVAKTHCNDQPLLFQDLGARKVVADFSGGQLSCDGGALLLRQVDLSLQLSTRVAQCFTDNRDARFVEHSVRELVAQRIQALALGYEDLNDHNHLRLDPVLAAAVGKVDPLGLNRRHEQDRGKALAGAATLNRMELSSQVQSAKHKLPCQADRLEDLILKMGVESLDRHASELVLDMDATDDPLHGRQEGRFFHGYYHNYCYLPLYGFVGNVPLWAQLRSSDRDGSEGTVAAMEKIIPALRKRCPKARIILRGDSGFCREEIMAWCEANGVKYVLGLARNARLVKELQHPLQLAKERQCLCGGSVRVYKDFEYQTHKTWSCSRRVIGKAEVTPQGSNPRFIVTNIKDQTATDLYEKGYCRRGQMENVIKQQQLDLAADRTSTAYLASNQLRLWFSTLAYMMLERLRAWGLSGSDLAQATVGTVRLKLLKIAAQVRVSVRRVYIQLNSSFPLQQLWRRCHRNIMRAAPTAQSG